ncbi:MAG: cyclic GMP-AMP synthase DncV-like nucleotidyltransferase [Maricaulaceae bacterium]
MPETVRDRIVGKYESMAQWLDRDGSEIKAFDPFVAPQGSMLLGLANRPVGPDEEYDVDLICRLTANKGDVTQEQLKQAVGREIIAYAAAKAMVHDPEEKRRCWRLPYADDDRFHTDILPCLPDADRYRQQLLDSGYQALAKDDAITEQAISITDQKDPNYRVLSENWPTSNPLGFAAWFFEQMAERLLVEKRNFLRRKPIYDSVEDVPNHRVKTTLQKAIQLLKRHRDTMFADDHDKKPISMIITTLSARAYGNEETLVEALSVILESMDAYIEDRGGVAWVANPVNPDENFADKWVEEPAKARAFSKWLRAARQDFGAYLHAGRPEDIPDILRERIGKKTVDRVKDSLRPAAVAAPTIITAAVPERVSAMAADVRERGTGSKPWRANER